MALSTLCYIGLLGAGASILVILIQCLRGKKAKEPLIAFGLSVLAILASGIFIPNAPQTGPTRQKADVVSTQNTQNRVVPSVGNITSTSAETEDPQPETEQLDINVPIEESDIEPEFEQIPDEKKTEQEQNRTASTATKALASTPSSKPKQTSNNKTEQVHTTEPGTTQNLPISAVNADTSSNKQQAPSLSENPALALDPVIAAMDNPQLATDDNSGALYNPSLSDEPESSQDLAQDVAPIPIKSADWTTSNRDGTYTHDFSSGRVLVTVASNNNGDPVYHTKNCQAAKKISGKDAYWFNSEKEAIADSRRLCGYCRR